MPDRQPPTIYQEASTPPHLTRTWKGRFRRRRRDSLGRWPFSVGICSVLAASIAIASLLERDALSPPAWTVIALIGIAVLPWFVDLLLVEVPPWLFAPAVIAVVALLHEPSGFDPLPLLLAVLALDMGLWLGPRRSAPVILVSVLVVAGTVLATTSPAPGAAARPLVSIALAWLVGLALHSQIQRISDLTRARQAAVSVALQGEQERVAAHVGKAVRQLDALLAEVRAVRACLDERDVDSARRRLDTAAEAGREIRHLLQPLAEQAPRTSPSPTNPTTSRQEGSPAAYPSGAAQPRARS